MFLPVWKTYAPHFKQQTFLEHKRISAQWQPLWDLKTSGTEEVWCIQVECYSLSGHGKDEVELERILAQRRVPRL